MLRNRGQRSSFSGFKEQREGLLTSPCSASKFQRTADDKYNGLPQRLERLRGQEDRREKEQKCHKRWVLCLLIMVHKSSLSDPKWGLSFGPASCGRCVPASLPPSLNHSPASLSCWSSCGLDDLHPLAAVKMYSGGESRSLVTNYWGEDQPYEERKCAVCGFLLVVH